MADFKLKKPAITSVSLCFLLLSLCISSCKKMLEIPPQTGSVAEDNVFTVDGTSVAVLTGLYSNMNAAPFQGNGIGIFTAISSDELKLFSGAPTVSQLYYRNSLSAIPVGGYAAGTEFWSSLYNLAYKCNAAIEGLNSDNAKSLTLAVRQQLLGEAKFMRGFCYFYLTNLFGDVPLVTTSDYKVNTLLPRANKTNVYAQIITDLKDAENLLSENYLNETLLQTTTERIRPTKWAAKALLARAYLSSSDVANAESEAGSVIGNTGLYDILPLNNVFLKNSKEAIWQIQPTNLNFNTVEGLFLNLTGTGLSGGRPYSISDQLWTSFEPGDLRAKPKNWIDTITVSGTLVKFADKYKALANSNINAASGTQNMTEYFMVLRLGEQYLIRAEARARQGKLPEAIADLDKIRARAGLSLIGNTAPNISQTALVDTILHERQVELFTEWGHRWFDLKRTGKIDQVMSVVTPLKSNGAVQWQSYQQLYPIPMETINASPNVKQNPGY